MNLKRSSVLLSAVAASAMLVAGCGSDNNSSSAGSSGAPDVSKSTAGCDGKAKLNAAGSSAQKNAMDQFVSAYKAACSAKGKDVDVAYNPSGSGDGRTQFLAKQTDFGGSDSAMSGDQLAKSKDRCDGNQAINIPMVFGPIAMAYNLEGVDKLVLNADTIAKIYNGGIKKWNDPAIAALNPGAKLPDQDITVFFRSDSSGTSDNFQSYLAAAAPQSWTQGHSSDFKGGVGQGAKGSSGVGQGVKSTPGSIGYVEWSFVTQNKLNAAQIDTGAGAVELTAATASKAVAGAKPKTEGSQDLALDLTATYTSKDPGTYPLMLATYEIVCGKGYDADTAKGVKSFLTSAANEGQTGLDAKGYVPLSGAFKDKVTASINAIS
ncbi:phosphate ABC transporter substrate-binding protein PstS [Mycobacterium sp. CBMA293]|uniref:phosphate ABC transporter substrate-binding protein PstS n=1 Tax=unclassified Mycolicibacterium TaxID=2636767 RepID=UPI001328480D|nr:MULTISPECIES: phosphate ABC transporter substrate-binding protein PstS [unclassified Mycolicibacterium]MUL47656.1 phosphate ABC transporter substrate-binding protein PstS [Mycolicibacterium sp. CBMA 360]MUL92884.1 phosphate ABC transporter substrate-binding protein PstS [Mycolicibacterium sp. CBMA 230]MUM30557.1 phosphate ABC transporter substrate-binding protein PstS [Mycolicibacterium sp. CBMA 361]MUL61826.1 phosphate ABC transporter substrate-binding protein PstS [Mycolicibacterium sp. CB